MGKIVAESDLAEIVIGSFEAAGFDVYREVLLPGGRRVDLVAVTGGIRIGIECKMSAGISVLNQARTAQPHFHAVYVAVPNHPGGYVFADCCRAIGVGCLHAGGEYDAECRRYLAGLSRLVEPRYNRTPAGVVLVPEQMQGAAGTRHGYSSPWSRTRDRLIELVRREPGLKIGEAVKRVEHHYRTLSTATSCLRQQVRDGLVPGVRFDDKYRLVPVPEVESER